MTGPVHAGGCLCGGVRYRIEGPLPPGGHCHCASCRRATGAVAVTWVTVPLARFRIVKGAAAVYRSSPPVERTFCPACGSSLTYFTRNAPDEIDVTLATLDDAAALPPDRHTFHGERLPWLRLDEHLVAYPGLTPPDRRAGS